MQKKKPNIQKKSKKSEQEIDSVSEQPEDYEVVIPILNLDVKNSEFRIDDIIVKKIGEKFLLEYGLKREFKDLHGENLFENIVDKPAAIIPINGNNAKLICENARKRAYFAIRVLQVALSSQWVLITFFYSLNKMKRLFIEKRTTHLPFLVIGN